MGSLRNPVGPLPSSIYWRRRSVAAVLIVLVAALIAWIVTSGGGGGKKHDDRGGGPAPATSITPGPGGSGPTIGGEPGGRDTSGGGSGGGSGDDDGGKNGDTAGSGGAGSPGGTGGAGSGGTGGDTAGTAGNAGAGSGGSGGSGGAGAAGTGGAAGIAAGRQVPAGSTLPTCGKGALKVALDSTKVAYEPDQKPQFRLVVTNSSATACKVDLGPKAMVLTITDTDDDRIWTSKDCPKTGTTYFEVPAHSTIAHTVTWDRRHSTTKCSSATPPAAGAGTYLAQITTGVATVPQAQSQKSIRLSED